MVCHSDLGGITGEQDFSRLEASEKSSEHKASFSEVGQTLEGQRSCPLDWQMGRAEEAAGAEAWC